MSRYRVFFAGLASISLHGVGLMFLPYLPNPSFQISQFSPAIKVVELTPSERSRIPSLTPSPKATGSLPGFFYEAVLPIAPKPKQLILSTPSSPSVNPSPQPPPQASSVKAVSKPISKPIIANIPINSPLPSPTAIRAASPQAPLVLPSAKANIVVAVETASPSLPDKGKDATFLEAPPSPSTPLPLEAEPPDSQAKPENSSQLSNLPDNKAENVEVIPNADNSDKLVFDSTSTSNEAGDRNYQDWLARVGISPTKFQKISIQGNYPEIACQKKLSGEVAVAILLDKDKQPNSPEVVKSSGYQVFDEQAIADAMSASFDSAVVGQPYIVTAKYQHNSGNCSKSTK